MSTRLKLALEAGLTLDEVASALLPTPDVDLSVLSDGVQVVQPFKPFFDLFDQAGYATVPETTGSCQDVLVFLPRAKALARALVYQASQRAAGTVVVDGAKTDGVDSLLKDIRKRVAVTGPLSKAHGKIFWFASDAEAFSDWAPPQRQTVDGFVTAPGVFSADGIDPASALLLSALPQKTGRRVADLGAGWGYLTSGILKDEGLREVHLVEADHTALNCARQNVGDPRAQFHWADACDWTAPEKLDAVIMNPPFHTGRSAEPALGQKFIQNAARSLTGSGHLWMVANRHLPYEATLHACFARVEEVVGDNRFKVFHASRARR